MKVLTYYVVFQHRFSRAEYSTQSECIVFTGTWNVNGKVSPLSTTIQYYVLTNAQLPTSESLSPWLRPNPGKVYARTLHFDLLNPHRR
jgi:hypothetical protein